MARRAAAYVLPGEAFSPRDASHRYRIYFRRGRDLGLPVAFAEDAGGVGEALLQLDADEREAGRRGLVDRGVLGVLDALERRWVVLPWIRGERPVAT